MVKASCAGSLTGIVSASIQMTTNEKTRNRVFAMNFAKVYPLYVAKAEKKGRNKSEVDTVIRWLTGSIFHLFAGCFIPAARNLKCARMLSKKAMKRMSQVGKLVAGAGFEPATFRL